MERGNVLIFIVFAGGFVVNPAVAYDQDHKPDQCAAGIDDPSPTRRFDDKKDNEADDVVKEDEKAHGAFVFDE